MYDVYVDLITKTEKIRFYSKLAARLWVHEKRIYDCVDVARVFLVDADTGEIVDEWNATTSY